MGSTNLEIRQFLFCLKTIEMYRGGIILSGKRHFLAQNFIVLEIWPISRG